MKKWFSKRLLYGCLALALVVPIGLSAPQKAHASMSAIPTPCDGFSDCLYTAYWYAFLR